MSIIYDALQKTQQTRLEQNNQDERVQHHSVPLKQPATKFGPKKWIGLSITFLIVSSGYLWQSEQHIKNTTSLATLPHKAIPQRSLPQNHAPALPHLTLNGVFISDRLKLAMIDDRPYEVGDKVGDFRVVSINTKSVKLQNSKQNIVLRPGG